MGVKGYYEPYLTYMKGLYALWRNKILFWPLIVPPKYFILFSEKIIGLKHKLNTHIFLRFDKPLFSHIPGILAYMGKIMICYESTKNGGV